ncbi:MAG: Na+/galactose cotransporter, partial [Candidatus Helarchaeota archaeon]|nr:Na+/galactose cotransporter [Candidatus Helarchaeota archaeon]
LATMLGWDFNTCIILSAGTVAVYVAFAGLTSAIFNEIIQFFLIWCGALLIPIIGLVEVGGWDNLVAMVSQRTAEMGKTGDFMHLWSSMGSYSDNPMGLHWLGIVLGLGWVVSFGYWTTDFLVVQRVLAAKDMRSAKMAPVIASFFKMAIPFVVILPGLIGIAVLPELKPADSGAFSLNSYNAVLPLLIKRYFAPGLLGLGVTALIAGFMSGMAGNISAFSTVWTYDIYRSVIYKKGTDHSYLTMGRICTVVGITISIGSAYLVMQFASIMDYMQALFSFFIAPLFGTVLLGMFWRRATNWGGFWGLLTGTCSSISMFLLLKFNLIEGKWVAFSNDASAMAQNMWRAWWAWCITVLITVIVSKLGKSKSDKELVGLVYGVTKLEKESSYPLFHRPSFWTCVSLVAFLILNIIFF